MREGLDKIVGTADTIVAISTPLGRSGIGVVRASGTAVRSIAIRLFQSTTPLQHSRAVRGGWLDLAGVPIDDVVVTLFESPRSYTGEDVLEISAHGNPVILNAIVEAVCAAGARAATPGEFTLRAVMHRKMDLTQAEAIQDFIHAQTDAQARTALKQMGGALSRRLTPAKSRLVDLIARLEAGIDFADDDVPPPDRASLLDEVAAVRANLDELRRTYAYGKLLGSGLRVAIIGKPNVGKSSLFNKIIESDRAIVTDIPGTTRDVLSEGVHLDGVPLRVFDTAGIRDTGDTVERIGVSRTLETLSDADLVLVVLDGSGNLTDEDRAVIARAESIPHVIVLNKCDVGRTIDAGIFKSRTVFTSARTGAGLDTLRDALREIVCARGGESLADTVLTNARQHGALVVALNAMETAGAGLRENVPDEMILLDLYRALGALNELTGEVVTDDILGRIFSTFCVGK